MMGGCLDLERATVREKGTGIGSLSRWRAAAKAVLFMNFFLDIVAL